MWSSNLKDFHKPDKYIDFQINFREQLFTIIIFYMFALD